MHIVLYTLIGDFGRVRAALLARFADQTVGVVPFQDSENTDAFGIQLRDGSTLHVRINTDPAFFQQHIPGMYGFYARVPCQDQKLHEAVLQQVRLFNCLASVAFEPSPERHSYVVGTLFGVAEDLAALVFMPDGSLYTSAGTLLLATDGRSDLTEYHPVANADWLDGTAVPAPADTARRDRSIAALVQRGIPYLPELYPAMPESDVNVRSPEEIASRLYAVFAMATYSEGRGGGETWDEAQKYPNKVNEILGGRMELSPTEAEYRAARNPPQQDVANFSFRYECCYVFMWARGLCDLGYPDRLCDVSAMAKVLWRQKNLTKFLKMTKPRTTGELLDATDLVLRYDWACVDARVKGQPAPAGLHGGVVQEWHYALNWLVSTDEWDSVFVST